MSDNEINWKEKWEQGQIGFHQEDFNSDLVTYMDMVVSKSGKSKNSSEIKNVFVPLCGKSKDMVWLSKKFKHVYGVELSSLAIDQFSLENDLDLKKTSQENFNTYKDDQYTLYQGDFFKLDKTHLSELSHVYDRASMIALPKEVRKEYAKHLSDVLEVPELFLITIDYDQNKVHGPPYSVPQDEIFSYYSKQYEIEIMSQVAISEGVPPRFAEQSVTIKKTVYSMIRKV